MNCGIHPREKTLWTDQFSNMMCEHPIMLKARQNALNALRNQTEINLARWIWVVTAQWLHSFEPSLPPKDSPIQRNTESDNEPTQFGGAEPIQRPLKHSMEENPGKIIKK